MADLMAFGTVTLPPCNVLVERLEDARVPLCCFARGFFPGVSDDGFRVHCGVALSALPFVPDRLFLAALAGCLPDRLVDETHAPRPFR